MKLKTIVESIVKEYLNESFKLIPITDEISDIILDWKQIEINGTTFDFMQPNLHGENTFIIYLNGFGEVGKADLNCYDKNFEGCYLDNIRIDPKYRRIGLATKLYEYIENLTGEKIKPSPIKQSPEIKKYWNKKDKLTESNNSDIKYKKVIDEDRITINAYSYNEKIGSITMDVLFDAYDYEFDDVFDEDEFYEIFPDDIILKIEHIEVDDHYKNSGIGSELMRRAIKLMKNKGYNQFYLNASPMGFSGLKTDNLVNFYKKFGFKEIKNQGDNVLMSFIS